MLSMLLAASLSSPQSSPEAGPLAKPTLKVSDYQKWESLGAGVISNDGKWYASRLATIGGNASVNLRSVDGPERWQVKEGGLAGFSDDSSHFASTVGFSRAESQSAQEARRTLEPRLSLRRLSDGSETIYERVSRWEFLRGGRYLAVSLMGPVSPPGQPPVSAAGDFQLIDLQTRRTISLASVSTFSLHRSGLVALQVLSPAGAKGLQVLNPATGSLRTLAWGKADLRSVVWARRAPALAWLESVKDNQKDGDNHRVKIATKLDGEEDSRTVEPQDVEGWKEDWRVSETGGLQISPDGGRLMFGLKPWESKKGPAPRPSTLPNVEIWHSQDSDVVPLQKSMAGMEQGRTSRAVWSLDSGKGRIVLDPGLDIVRVGENLDRIWASDLKKHDSAVKVNGIEFGDLWTVNTLTGERTLVLEKRPANVGFLGLGAVSASPTGRYALYFEGKHWMLFDAQTGRRSNLTQNVKDSFVDDEDDRTLPEPTPWSGAQWGVRDQYGYISDEFDIYRISLPSGTLTKLTNGRPQNIRCGLLDLDTEEDGLDATQDLFVSLNNLETMASGVAKVEKPGEVKPLFYEDKAIRFVRRSRDTDRVLFRRSSFGDSPDDFVTNLAFSAAKPMTRTNSQQKEFAWGKSELVGFKTKHAGEQKAILHYPANYRPGRFYPLVVYIYERLSQGLHDYEMPNLEGPYALQHYIQNGYFVLQPDIAYRGRNPGLSAVDCVESAVRAVLAKKIGVDGARLGLMGHSWGGYQTVFIATQSKLFAAYSAGAPLTELVSMYSSFYFNWGQTNQVIFESSQGRFDVPFWQDLKSYIDNSPLYHAQNIKAPMLVQAGTSDGAVDWTQSQFLYNTLRRMGKDMVMLVYPGENHNLATPANARDYARRQAHFFDVHLKRAKSEDWLAKGVPFVNIDQERARAAKTAEPR
jgi:dipeptidyl aminopeptidase/acylaminoacyl peptidase